jgi:hypothetical protein
MVWLARRVGTVNLKREWNKTGLARHQAFAKLSPSWPPLAAKLTGSTCGFGRTFAESPKPDADRRRHMLDDGGGTTTRAEALTDVMIAVIPAAAVLTRRP